MDATRFGVIRCWGRWVEEYPRLTRWGSPNLGLRDGSALRFGEAGMLPDFSACCEGATAPPASFQDAPGLGFGGVVPVDWLVRLACSTGYPAVLPSGAKFRSWVS
jgi:hypothetical protein